MIQHTVAFRFHDDADTAAFWLRVDDLASIVGVEQFTVMRQVGRKNDFTDALSMHFASDSEYVAYNSHPVHTTFVDDVWKPSVADFIELDYVSVDR
ncbi:MAG: Dabb family protein [Ilumatobacteraceae bacterium]